MKQIYILNGPNLNMLGKRETSIYGNDTFDNILLQLQEQFPQVILSYFQSNSEGEIIDFIQSLLEIEDIGLIINAGAYSHYSYAIQDALKLLTIPKIEVHLSNIYQREPFRHFSVLSSVCNGTITGLGKLSYFLAVQALIMENE